MSQAGLPPPPAAVGSGSGSSHISGSGKVISSSVGDNDSSDSSSAESPVTTFASVRRKARRALREQNAAAIAAPTPLRAYGRSPRPPVSRAATLASALPAFDELVHRPRQMRFNSFVRVVSFVADEPVRVLRHLAY